MNGNPMVTALLAIVSGIIGLSIVSVLVSPRAQTPTVLGAAGSALSNVIGAAVSPVTGQNVSSSSSGGGLSNISNILGTSSSLLNAFGGLGGLTDI